MVTTSMVCYAAGVGVAAALGGLAYLLRQHREWIEPFATAAAVVTVVMIPVGYLITHAPS